MEITLFDKNGHAIAYVADDEESSIYLWRGHAVAYVDNEVVYGWNGHHLGWFLDGVVYDLNGRRAGFVKQRCPVAAYTEPAKYAKYAKYARYARYAAFARPALSTGYSEKDLKEFLQQGAV